MKRQSVRRPSVTHNAEVRRESPNSCSSEDEGISSEMTRAQVPRLSSSGKDGRTAPIDFSCERLLPTRWCNPGAKPSQSRRQTSLRCRQFLCRKNPCEFQPRTRRPLRRFAPARVPPRRKRPSLALAQRIQFTSARSMSSAARPSIKALSMKVPKPATAEKPRFGDTTSS
jgi:hypothetical protein